MPAISKSASASLRAQEIDFMCELPPNHTVHEMLERRTQVAALTRVHRRCLHDSAFGRDQPMKSLARGQFADRPCVRPAQADRSNSRHSTPYEFEVHFGLQCHQLD